MTSSGSIFGAPAAAVYAVVAILAAAGLLLIFGELLLRPARRLVYRLLAWLFPSLRARIDAKGGEVQYVGYELTNILLVMRRGTDYVDVLERAIRSANLDTPEGRTLLMDVIARLLKPEDALHSFAATIADSASVEELARSAAELFESQSREASNAGVLRDAAGREEGCAFIGLICVNAVKAHEPTQVADSFGAVSEFTQGVFEQAQDSGYYLHVYYAPKRGRHLDRTEAERFFKATVNGLRHWQKELAR